MSPKISADQRNAGRQTAVGYKTPLSLLTERCQKSGWDRPSVDPKKGSEPNSWTASITLRRKNPKSGESETVYMRPPPRQFPTPCPFPQKVLLRGTDSWSVHSSVSNSGRETERDGGQVNRNAASELEEHSPHR